MSALTLAPARGPRAETHSVLCLEGEPTGTELAGTHLEASLDTPHGTLLFVTLDCPYEEELALHLVDADGALLDSLHLGRPYTPGVLRDLTQHVPTSATFRFFGEDDAWSVHVERARRSLASVRSAIPGLGAPITRPLRTVLRPAWLRLERVERDEE